MSSLQVYTTATFEKWRLAVESLPGELKDIYYTPQFHSVFEKHGDGQALCMIYSTQQGTAINCCFLNSVNQLGYSLDKEYFDLQSVYGYSGLLSSTDDVGFIESARQAIESYCLENSIIAEFSRFHPLLNNYKHDSNSYHFDRETIAVDLSKGYEEVWKNQYSNNARNMVRKAIKLKYSAEFLIDPDDEDINCFIRLYSENMNRVKANSYYFFNEGFFHNFFRELKENVTLINIKDEKSKTVCSSIFMKWNKYFHYHLSGRLSDADNSVSSYLLDRAICFAAEGGYDFIHLGGGRSSDPNDTLLKFKKNFSMIRKEFFIGKRIYQQEIYEEVVRQWAKRFPALVNTYKNQLLKYRIIGDE